MKFPTYEEMAQKVAEQALDEFLYNGKSIREWMQIIASEDCISRQVVLAILKDKWNIFSDANDAIQESIDTIEALRPVTAELKTGHWIKISPSGIYECSECGQNVMTSDICAYKFCHGCGIRMLNIALIAE